MAQNRRCNVISILRQWYVIVVDCVDSMAVYFNLYILALDSSLQAT